MREHQAKEIYKGRAWFDFIKRGQFQTDGFAVYVDGHTIAECEDSECADWMCQAWNAALPATPQLPKEHE